jgi:GNAT superfamily N-acetyltransferase
MIDLGQLQHLPEITIRSYVHRDFDHAYRVIRAIGTGQLGKDLRSWDKVFTELSGFMWVACVDATPIAFAGMSLPSDGIVFLHTDLVTPSYQRRGVGTVLTLTRLAALAGDEIDGVGVLATEHSAPFYARFGFETESEPQHDPFAGFHMHRMSMPFTPILGQSAESLLDGLKTVTFDTSPEDGQFVTETQA